MNLRDGVLWCRLQLTELRAHFYSDTEIIIHLNDAAQKMTSAAQCNNGFVTFTTRQIGGDGDDSDVWAQEYVLPLDVDQITGVSYVAGNIFPLVPAKRENLQLGSYVGGIPIYFYEKKNTRILTQQVANGIHEYPIAPTLGPDPRTTIGLWPVPQQATPIYVWYIGYHPTMQNPFDPVNIPPRFKKAWCAYAMARLKEKEGALTDASYWDTIHENGTQEFIEWQITNGQEISMPSYSTERYPQGFLRGASSVIVVAQNPGLTNF